MNDETLLSDISRDIWDTKYRYREGTQIRDHTLEDTWRRVARALAAVEPHDRATWEARFFDQLRDFRFLPGGRILAGAGTGRRVTLYNCFVMGRIEDSMDGIFDALKEGALTMQQGGGVGYDFSTLRPAGNRAWHVGGIASGPVSFMRVWDSACATLLSTGARRGAMMATLRCDHPDVEAFIDAKQDPRELRHFNLSIQITDAFMEAVRSDADWPLVFPDRHLERGDGPVELRTWPGEDGQVPCRVLRVVRARSLWNQILRASYDYAEPGVLFVDRVNELNNLWYREHITATNPCGEIPLPPYGACDLGSLNLTRFVQAPFTPQAQLDEEALEAAAGLAVRMLDNVTDVSGFPLEHQREQAQATRRVGLGVTGLADLLIMLGVRYGSEASYHLAASVMERVCHAAYRASVELAREKGSFPAFDRDCLLEGRFVASLPSTLRDAIARHGLRNSHLTAIAPTGTISLLANNVSSGLEPVFEAHFTRRVHQEEGDDVEREVEDYACRLWRERGNDGFPPAFVDAHDLDPEAHLRMQAALQPFVDNAISKTINIPEDFDFASYGSVYERAFDLGLKGCTTFRPNPVTGSVLAEIRPPAGTVHCCGLEREPD
ncbi:adenosylcobalamin-dependent ribonucleoside-diphosphate reductase [Thiohalobacter thiocyanaticus]|uniref:Vitamin B12-dependent ribonucleotide reductase n=1 Tax=Thiohalobacter thiocyanaticus TaxID=585455 RepID=A0A426QGV8_9GAMM|nr:adenosylcobalamin-dependent ribonucleoside-diphosphate reductase [Thiohalobacter thiocyanaticus]RRQ20991.1 adenosylcobalamin-dependent ribonucleoside-diphosphate reductase [Thiohalobacter thiocyanaticus]